MSLLGTIVLSLNPAFCGELESASITFNVTVPGNRASDAKVYIAGSHAAAGRWKPASVLLTRRDDGRFHGQVTLRVGSVLAYKITQVSWETVEQDAGGGELANRRLRVDKDVKLGLVGKRGRESFSCRVRSHAI